MFAPAVLIALAIVITLLLRIVLSVERIAGAIWREEERRTAKQEMEERTGTEQG